MANLALIRSSLESPSSVTASEPLDTLSSKTIQKEIENSSTLSLIFDRIENKIELTPKDASILIGQKLTLLQFLADRVIKNYKIPTSSRIKRVLFIPLAKSIELTGSQKAVQNSINLINCASKIENDIIQVVIDRWYGSFQNEKLTESIKEIKNSISENTKISIIFLGPSTSEIRAALDSQFIKNNYNLISFLKQLKNAEIRIIEGGSDYEILKKAASNNFSLRISRQIKSYSELNQQINKLKKLTRGFETWSPIPQNFNINYLKLLTLSRILLPEVPYIRGYKSLIHLSCQNTLELFATNDFGYVAINRNTKEQLEIPSYSQLELVKLNRLYERISVS